MDEDDATAITRLIQRLRSEREARGLSLNDVARRADVGASTFSRMERGVDRNPTIITLARYARALGMRLSLDLVTLETDPPRPPT
jgi:transcriptional regulator with XRE-family HTH domain